MTDIINKLWVNIDNFNYKRIDLVSNISQDDIDRLHKTNKNFLMKPTIFLIATLTISKYRSKLWNKLKEFLYKDRVFPIKEISKENESLSKLSNSPSHFVSNTSQPNEIKFVYVKDNANTYSEESTIKLRTLRRFSKRNKNQEEDDIITITRQEPTVSEEYLGFISNHKKSVHKLSSFKSLMKKFADKNVVYIKGESFVLKSKLVYLPFVIVLLLSLYELMITYGALYFKYQPLVDEYYNQQIKSSL